MNLKTLAVAVLTVACCIGCGADPKPRKDAAATDASDAEAAADRAPADGGADDGGNGADVVGRDAPIDADGSHAPEGSAPDGPAQDLSDAARQDVVDGGGSIDGDAGPDGGEGPDVGTDAGRDTGIISFTAVSPCNLASDYVAGMTVTFKMTAAAYTPKCLKVPRGATVTFQADGGTFADHPLRPSAKRGDRTNNPITRTESGTSAAFAFPDPGYFAYFCALHGFTDTGTGSMMDGVVWVQ